MAMHTSPKPGCSLSLPGTLFAIRGGCRTVVGGVWRRNHGASRSAAADDRHGEPSDGRAGRYTAAQLRALAHDANGHQLPELPMDTWHGVTTDAEGRIIELAAYDPGPVEKPVPAVPV